MTALWAQYARYNRLANETLYDACAGLSDADYRRDLGAFFGSVEGTLNHLLLGDGIWMARFEGGSHPSTDLGALQFDSFEALRVARRAMDARIERFFATLPPGFAKGTVRYVNNSGFDTEDPLEVILPHFFNHQTHHRGQVHTLLSQLGLGRKAPVLDLHRVLRPNPT
ncbi:MAG: damage-inducible protein DinB [Alphaproteobacteria bacterium]|nr:damage-inducible protein DinB [Alphaproteobacteria bacterium]